MSKILYFEGAGWADADISKATIGNCRIRTCFTNNEGRKIYLELGSCALRKGEKEYKGMIDTCFYIDTESKDAENECQIRNMYNRMDFMYTKEAITNLINKELNCNFDTIEVLPNLAGYKVHGDNGTCNLMGNYIYNPKLIQKREEIYKYFYDLEKSEGKRYPNFSLWVDSKDINLLHLLRHFNGYNKHWTIRTDVENWRDSVQEIALGKYAC